MTCWKNANSAAAESDNIRIGETLFTPQEATEQEIRIGREHLNHWRVERLYEVMVSGRGVDHPYVDWRSEPQEIAFSQLIFCDGVCIGVYHAGCVMLFGDPSTHKQQVLLGEFVTGPDRTRVVYDYYQLSQVE